MDWKKETVLNFINCIKERPAMWDSETPEYKMKHKRRQAVAEVAMSMGVSEKEVIAKWTSLRNQFCREKRKMTVAKYHDVPFYVAAPLKSIDMALTAGERIKIEERPDREMTHIGELRIAAPGINCSNPSFDVTPASLTTGIITENGVFATLN